MATKPRLCVNCKHYRKGLIFSCRRDAKVRYEQDVVTGKNHKLDVGGDAARQERKDEGSQYCGPSAKFYVEKRLTKRLIALFKP